MKQKSIAKLKEIKDKEWSLKVRERDEFKCQKCGVVNKHNHAAHIFSRNSLSVRYDLRNGVCLCYYCHIVWSHRCPIEFAEWCRNRLGKVYEELKKLSQKLINNPREFLENLWKNEPLKAL